MALTRLLTSSASERPSLKKIEWMCFSTARLLSTRDSAIALLLFPWAIWARTSRSRGVRAARDERSARPFEATSRSTILGSTTEPPSATVSRAERSCSRSSHALLEQVSAALRARLEQGQRVERLGVLAEHHHAHVRVGLPQERREPDPLVAVGRGHPDVRQDHVRWIGLDCLEQRGEICVHAHELDVLLSGEHLLEALAHEQIVVRDDDADGHRAHDNSRPCAIAVDAPPCKCRRTPWADTGRRHCGPCFRGRRWGTARRLVRWHPNRHQ